MNSKTKKRQKIRRWSYVAHISKDGQTHELPLQTLSIGTSKSSKQSAQNLEAQLRAEQQFDGYDLKVISEGHETISPAIMGQLQGMEFELTVYRRAVKKLAEQQFDQANPVAADHIFDDVANSKRTGEVAKLAGRAVIESRVELQKETLPAFEELASQEEAEAAAEASAALPETINEEPEVEQPRRKLGIDAVNELISTPLSADEASQVTAP
jgi:hypothetical protein